MQSVSDLPKLDEDLNRLRIAADRGERPRLEQFLERFATTSNIGTPGVWELWVAVHEIVENAIVHGYRGAPGSIEIVLWWEGDSLVVRIRDAAPRFDPTAVPQPNAALPLDQRLPGGMGLPMVRQFVDEMRYRVTPEGQNEVLLIKHGLTHDAALEVNSSVE